MTNGLPINRHLIVVLMNGAAVIDWGEGLGVDLFSGEFLQFKQSDYCHAIQDEELEMLKKAGRIVSYDQREVFVSSLPEMPRRYIT
jgi:hypothetical protein